MKSNIAPIAPIQDPGVRLTPPVAEADVFVRPATVKQQNADLRLVIEEDQSSGTFVYKTLDRRTGEIVRQFPREQVVRLKDTADYTPGDVIDSHS